MSDDRPEIERRLDGVINLTQAAAVARCSSSLIRVALVCGALHGAKIGGRQYVMRTEVKEWNRARQMRLLDARSPRIKLRLLAAMKNADLEFLPERSRDMVQRRFGLNGYPIHTLDQTGEVYGLSRERARQLIKSASDGLLLRLLLEKEAQAAEESPQVLQPAAEK